MPTPHKHAELIKKWAEDTTLEFEVRVPRAGRLDTVWEDLGRDSPAWNPDLEYRIIPKLVKREGWMLVKRLQLPAAFDGGVVYPNSFVYTDEREVPARTGGFTEFIKIKVEWEEEV